MPPSYPSAPFLSELDAAIAQLYRAATDPAAQYKRRALTLLTQYIDFEGALWGSGHLESETFHSVDILGVEESYPEALAQTKTYNPIYDVLKAHPGKVINMQAVTPDDEFYKSDLYQTFFARYGVERVMGVVLPDPVTGIFHLISLYRFEREKTFSQADAAKLERLAYHMVQGASQAYFYHLQTQAQHPHRQEALAICDQHGVFVEAQPEFIQLIKQYYPSDVQRLPFPLAETLGDHTLTDVPLSFRQEALSDLFVIALWERSSLDLLSAREQEVVNAIVQGLSFKEAAKKIGVAPSTVSNHLYKIYRKLNISSRSELADLINSLGH